MNIEENSKKVIELVKEINRYLPMCQIVYISSSFSHIMDIYETKHSYYVLKDKFEEKLPSIMLKAMRELKANNKNIVLQCHGSKILRIKLDEIMYFERNLRVTYVVTQSSRYIVDDKINELEQQIVNGDFCRCHTSFLVNFAYVKECTRKRLVLENGQAIDISRSYWGKVEKEYLEWAKKAMM